MKINLEYINSLWDSIFFNSTRTNCLLPNFFFHNLEYLTPIFGIRASFIFLALFGLNFIVKTPKPIFFSYMYVVIYVCKNFFQKLQTHPPPSHACWYFFFIALMFHEGLLPYLNVGESWEKLEDIWRKEFLFIQLPWGQRNEGNGWQKKARNK